MTPHVGAADYQDGWPGSSGRIAVVERSATRERDCVNSGRATWVMWVALLVEGDVMATVLRRRAMTARLEQPSGRPKGLWAAGDSTRFFRPEGVSLVLSGALFFIKAIFDAKVGEPPSAAAELVAWRSAEESSLAMTNEVQFFAIVLLIPGAIGLYSSLAGFHPRKAAWGCGLVAAIIPVMMALTIVHGRLAFPVYGIDLKDPASTQLVVSLYYGGQHAVGLLFGVATIILALAMRNTPYGRAIVAAGLVVAIVDFVGAYPWLIGLGLTSVSEMLFAAWFIAVGARLATATFPSSKARRGS